MDRTEAVMQSPAATGVVDSLCKCDIVMKGGVTSGIVYPPAVRELAEAFRFVNIGGTSAGAIAASLTAAAEYRRQRDGSLAGFDRLARVPYDLAQDRALIGLFAPNRSTQLIFEFAMSFVNATSLGERVRQIVTLPFVGSQRAVSWTIATLGIALAAAELVATPASWLGAAATVALAFAIGGAVGMLLTLRHALATLVTNNYGLASGIDATGKNSFYYERNVLETSSFVKMID